MRNKILGAAFLSVVTLASACSKTPAKQGAGGGAGGGGAMPPMPVDVDTARAQNIVDAVRATGRIEALNAVDLRPDAEGRVTQILFVEGQNVAQGAALVRIDDALLRAQAMRARADRDLARQQLARAKRLHDQNASSPADYERAQAVAQSADATLSMLELQISRTTVRAPFSGVVGQRFVSVGDFVTNATRLLTLQTVDPERAVIEIPERYAIQLKPGQDLDFTVAAQPGRTFKAHVTFIDPVVQSASRTILVKANAPNRDRLLRPGMFIEARLATATHYNAVVVPEDAIQPLRTANIVWAVVGGKASRREVQLGTRSEGFVEILSGVKAGELVVVGGLERMGEGMPVMGMPHKAGLAAQPGSSATATKPASK